MTNSKFAVSVLLLLLAVSLSCKLFNRTTSRSNGPKIDFVTPGKPLNVNVQLDKKQTASKLVPRTGGSVSLTTTDGSKFMLDVPADALDADTTITMTAVKSIAGAPLGEDPPTAVQLEPSGLFFKQVATLTVVPAKEIPIKNQIIFGYEGDGKDYHLAVVDPKSKDIKIKLMRFSGAGVGSGSDSAWAANLQIQASDARTRLLQKLGEATQASHRSQLLAGEGNESAAMIDSFFEQFYDQVILKEIAAAELDCKHAQQAVDDLMFLEKLRQHLGGSSSDEMANRFAENALRLMKIAANCPAGYTVSGTKGYTVSGTSGPVTFSGQICSLDKPFVINGKFANGSETQSFTPSSSTGGTVVEAGNSGGCTNSGGGSYTVTLNEQGSGELQWTESITSSCPPYSVRNTVTHKLPLKPASGLTCP
jgi:hypothetical protein